MSQKLDVRRDGNPYQSLSTNAFWRSAVADRPMFGIRDLWAPKFNIAKKDRIATAGSCFAQHISRALVARGFSWLDAEPAPPGLSAEQRSAFGFGVFSFRTGNIYTVALLRQWLSWALGKAKPAPEAWVDGDRIYDPFRPNIEPNGFASVDEMLASRSETLRAIRYAVAEGNVFVFTLGLTEAWINADTGVVYPICPGTIAGIFDPLVHKFHNYSYTEVLSQLDEAVQLMRSVNRDLRVLLTVSPVPLTATASDEHVLVATTYSKSTLRAVAGDFARSDASVDYFPSYEMITAVPFRGVFFAPNLRSVAPEGVEFVMKSFFEALVDPQSRGDGPATSIATPVPAQLDRSAWAATRDRERALEETQCEEELLEAFGDMK